MKWAPSTRREQTGDPRRFEEPDSLKKLLAAGARAESLGIAVMDSQTRFESINASLAREMRINSDGHMGKTTCELVGDVGLPMEQVHERVLRLRQSESLLVEGKVRDTPEYGYWLNHCFPISDRSGRVQQLGLFVVNVTAEAASFDIFDALAGDSKLMMAEAAGLLNKFDESIKHYYAALKKSFDELACPLTEPSRKVDCLRSSIIRLDNEICAMRELVFAVQAHFSIPKC